MSGAAVCGDADLGEDPVHRRGVFLNIRQGEVVFDAAERSLDVMIRSKAPEGSHVGDRRRFGEPADLSATDTKLQIPEANPPRDLEMIREGQLSKTPLTTANDHLLLLARVASAQVDVAKRNAALPWRATRRLSTSSRGTRT